MPHIWPIGGGKGGSGKTFVTGCLGVMLAKEGHKTLLIDVDLGAANLHSVVGLSHPEQSLSDFVNRKVDTLDKTVVPTATPNLYLISGAMNNLDVANLAYEQKNRILRHIVKLPYDYILLDLGAGTAFNTIDFFMISTMGVFITVPEPTSIENIYRLIRAVYIRKVKQVLSSHTFKTIAEEAEARNSRANVTNPPYLLYVIKEMDPETGRVLEEALRSLEFSLIVNQHRKQDNPLLGRLMGKIIEKHLTVKMHFRGNISFDDRVHNAVCRNKPFIDAYPYTQTAMDLRECFRNLLVAPGQAVDMQTAIQ